jgi:NAD(P)-dependent dehydrogenase (short-subunit alcohol dehydrogenase family)
VANEVYAARGRMCAVEMSQILLPRLFRLSMPSSGASRILVNNAAIFSTLERRPLEEIPLSEWKVVLRVNVTGPFLCARGVLPMMCKLGKGRIINIAFDGESRAPEISALHRLEGRPCGDATQSGRKNRDPGSV